MQCRFSMIFLFILANKIREIVGLSIVMNSIISWNVNKVYVSKPNCASNNAVLDGEPIEVLLIASYGSLMDYI